MWSWKVRSEVRRPWIRRRAEVRHCDFARMHRVNELARREGDDPGVEAAVDPPAEVVERRCHDRDREDVLHRGRHDVLAPTCTGFVRHEADVDQPHDDDGPVVELLGQDLAVEGQLVRQLLRRRHLSDESAQPGNQRRDDGDLPLSTIRRGTVTSTGERKNGRPGAQRRARTAFSSAGCAERTLALAQVVRRTCMTWPLFCVYEHEGDPRVAIACRSSGSRTRQPRPALGEYPWRTSLMLYPCGLKSTFGRAIATASAVCRPLGSSVRGRA